MAGFGRNEGFRMLEEFSCEAISRPEAPRSGRWGRGANSGAIVDGETVFHEIDPTLTTERVAELRAMSSSELLALVRLAGQDLDRHELILIHEIAGERLGADIHPTSQVAIELSRQAMLVAVNRSA